MCLATSWPGFAFTDTTLPQLAVLGDAEDSSYSGVGVCLSKLLVPQENVILAKDKISASKLAHL